MKSILKNQKLIFLTVLFVLVILIFVTRLPLVKFPVQPTDVGIYGPAGHAQNFKPGGIFSSFDWFIVTAISYPTVRKPGESLLAFKGRQNYWKTHSFPTWVSTSKAMKKNGKTTIFRPHFWNTHDERNGVFIPADNSQKGIIKFYGSRIDKIFEGKKGKELLKYTDIIMLAEENPSSKQTVKVLNVLYDYIKKKYGKPVCQNMHGATVGNLAKGDCYVINPYMKQGMLLDTEMKPYIKAGKPTMILIFASTIRGWAKEGYDAFHEQVKKSMLNKFSVGYFLAGETKYTWDCNQTPPKKVTTYGKPAWESKDPILSRIWKMVLEKNKEIKGLSFNKNVYTDLLKQMKIKETSEKNRLLTTTVPKPTKVVYSEDFQSYKKEPATTSNQSSPALKSLISKGWNASKLWNSLIWVDASNPTNKFLIQNGPHGFKFLLLPGEYENFSLKTKISVRNKAMNLGLAFGYKNDKNSGIVVVTPFVMNFLFYDFMEGGVGMSPTGFYNFGKSWNIPEWHDLELIRKGDMLYIKYDGKLVVADKVCSNKGKVGLMTWGGSTAFDDVKLSVFN